MPTSSPANDRPAAGAALDGRRPERNTESAADPRATQTERWMSLADYTSGSFQAGGSFIARMAWYVLSLIIFESGWFPLYSLKRRLLRLFGATIGKGVVIKPHVRIKYPWRLRVGDHSWIGEGVWIDNLADVHIGRSVCVSQGVYLCTGSHDHRQVTFDLVVAPIAVGDEAWIAARAVLLPGAAIPAGVVVAAGSVVPGRVSLPEGVIVAGVPARMVGLRLAKPAAAQNGSIERKRSPE
jgi:putative colanic acid biosynthesis acetyltransferase WcaF